MSDSLFPDSESPLGDDYSRPAPTADERERKLTRRMRVLLRALKDDGRPHTISDAAELFGCTRVELEQLWRAGLADRRTLPGGAYTFAATITKPTITNEGQEHAEPHDGNQEPLR